MIQWAQFNFLPAEIGTTSRTLDDHLADQRTKLGIEHALKLATLARAYPRARARPVSI